MTCEQVQAEMLECWGSTEDLGEAAVAHLGTCEQCRYEARILRGTHAMIRSLPSETAPGGFTQRVLGQVAQQDAQPGWAARIGEILMPSRQPSWARAAAVGAALALAVAGGTVWVNGAFEADPQEQIAAGAASSVVVSDAAATDAELIELMARHQALEMTQPLADDAGINLVAYTSN